MIVESERVNTADAPAPAASNPPAAGLVKCPDFVMRCMKPTGEIEDITPPLRGSRRGRAFYAKADSVGGKMRFIAIPSYTPHRFGFGGKTPLPHRRSSRGGKTDPQGGSELQRLVRNPKSLLGAISSALPGRVLSRAPRGAGRTGLGRRAHGPEGGGENENNGIFRKYGNYILKSAKLLLRLQFISLIKFFTSRHTLFEIFFLIRLMQEYVLDRFSKNLRF